MLISIQKDLTSLLIFRLLSVSSAASLPKLAHAPGPCRNLLMPQGLYSCCLRRVPPLPFSGLAPARHPERPPLIILSSQPCLPLAPAYSRLHSVHHCLPRCGLFFFLFLTFHLILEHNQLIMWYFRCTAEQLSRTYTCIHYPPNSPPTQALA